MKYSWMLAAICGLFLGSCNTDGGSASTTAIGNYQYEHHVKTGGETPKVGEYAYFHVYMRNPETGEVSYNSRDVPQMPKVAIPNLSEDKTGQPPSPVVEALTLMSEGDSLTIFQPLDSLPRKPQGFENATTIAYDIALVDIKSAAEYKKENEALQAAAAKERELLTGRQEEVKEKVAGIVEQYNAGQLDDKIQTTDTGLKYIIHEEGTGPVPEKGQTVKANYYGVLTDGTMFDNNFRRGQSFQFPVGQGRVIPGWDQGFGMLKEGTKATLFVPADLGYGAAGSPPAIPANSELIFYVELDEVL